MVSNFENFSYKNDKNTKSENQWSDNTSFEAHLTPSLFYTGDIGFQVSVHYVFRFMFYFVSYLSCLFEIYTFDLLHGYSTLDSNEKHSYRICIH